MAEAASDLRGGAALPAPKRTLRSATLAVMAVTALLAGLLAYSIHREVLYVVRDPAVVDLGDVKTAKLEAHENDYVRVHVDLDAPATKFRRPLERSHYRVAQAAPDRWVVYAMPDGYAEQRFLPPRLVAGRLAKASTLGVRFSGVTDLTGGDAWVVVDGDAPYGMTWLLGLEIMLLGFVLFNLGGILQVLRPVR